VNAVALSTDLLRRSAHKLWTEEKAGVHRGLVIEGCFSFVRGRLGRWWWWKKVRGVVDVVGTGRRSGGLLKEEDVHLHLRQISATSRRSVIRSWPIREKAYVSADGEAGESTDTTSQHTHQHNAATSRGDWAPIHQEVAGYNWPSRALLRVAAGCCSTLVTPRLAGGWAAASGYAIVWCGVVNVSLLVECCDHRLVGIMQMYLYFRPYR
jgi:hypothetical protein